MLNKLYQDSASMVWNGNPVQGSEKIQQFLDKLPISVHTVDSLDGQPIPCKLMNRAHHLNSQTFVLFTKSSHFKWLLAFDFNNILSFNS